jgi:glutathione synthase
MQICNAVGPELKRRGLLLAGLDVIGGRLTEINVTSPTGFQAINQLSNLKLERNFWDVVETKIKQREAKGLE